MPASVSSSRSASPSSRPSGRLLPRLLLATLAPTLAALVFLGLFSHTIARRAIEDETGHRLATAALAVASGVFPGQLKTTDESSASFASAQMRLERARARFHLRRVLLIAPDLTARGDTALRAALGAAVHELGQDGPEIARALAGEPSWSRLFVGPAGEDILRAYAPIAGSAGGGGEPEGLAVVEGQSDSYEALASFRRTLLAASLLALFAIVLVTVLVASRITGPVTLLAAEAERLGRGQLDAPITTRARGEIGVLARALEDARAALKARDERTAMTLAGIAHEVRNPLGGLELFAGLLRDALAGQPDRLAEVARIEREIGHLAQIVNDFLAYARRAPPQLAPVEASALLGEVAELARGERPAIEVVSIAEPPLVIAGDRAQLRRVFLNLAKNAVAAARSKVILAARREGGQIVFEVRDDGPGIAPELRARVLEPFYTTREKGTGLGLAFVAEIVSDHGSRIEIGEAPEGGARFRFALPAA